MKQLNLRLVDVNERARRLWGNEYMGTDLTVPDYRFEMDTPTGGVFTFHRGADANYIHDLLEYKGWL